MGARLHYGRQWAPTGIRASEPAPRRLSRFRSESGQAAVEFGLVVPFICVLVLAIFDFAKVLNYWLDANHLANEGARLAAVLGSRPEPSPSLRGYIKQQAETAELRDGSGSVTAPGANVNVCFPAGSTPKIGDPVQVTVTAAYKWIPFIGAGTITLRGQSTMRLEQIPTYTGDACP
jgi:Flp pilus assembly pilin Flp